MFGYSYIAYLLSLEANGKTSKKSFIFLPTLPVRSWVKIAGGPTSILRYFQTSLEEGMATHSSILAWRLSWTKEPGRLQSIVLQAVRRD